MLVQHLLPFLAAGLSQALAAPTTTLKTVSSATSKTTTAQKSTSTPSPSASNNCVAPAAPSGRSVCSSEPAGAFNVRLAHCGNKYDDLYLNPIFNTTANSALVYLSPTPPESSFEYPPSFTSGPWAWNGEFAYDVNSATSGLSAVIFEGGSTGTQLSCYLQTDLVPFQCYDNGNLITSWYVGSKTGEVFAATKKISAAGYVQVAPYIIQACSAPPAS